jgi:hypothetical protein
MVTQNFNSYSRPEGNVEEPIKGTPATRLKIRRGTQRDTPFLSPEVSIPKSIGCLLPPALAEETNSFGADRSNLIRTGVQNINGNWASEHLQMLVQIFHAKAGLDVFVLLDTRVPSTMVQKGRMMYYGLFPIDTYLIKVFSTHSLVKPSTRACH